MTPPRDQTNDRRARWAAQDLKTELQRTCRPGFHGALTLDIRIMDGVIQTWSTTTEQRRQDPT